MAAEFNPYHVWFGIPPQEQPADHYCLLGLRSFEDNADVIANGMEQRLQFLRSRQMGKYQALSQRLANEVSAAAGCLLDAEQKAAYDRWLRERRTPTTVEQPAIPLAPLTPIVVGPADAGPSAPRHPAAVPGGIAAAVLLVGLLVAPLLALGLWAAGLFDSPEPIAAPPVAAPESVLVPPAGGVELVPPPATLVNPPTPAVNNKRPAVAAPALAIGKIDLLQGSVDRMVVKRGAVSRRQGALCLEGAATALAIPVKFPEQYALEADVVRESGRNSLCFGFPVHHRPLTAIVDGFYAQRSGLACINGQELFSPTSRLAKDGAVLTNGQTATVRIEVTRELVELAVNGKSIVRWQYDPRARVNSAQGMQAAQLDQLHVFAWDSSYRLTRLELVPLPPDK